VALPFGLFSTFTFRPNGAERWEAGIAWESIPCDPADAIGYYDWQTPASTIGLPKDFTEETPGDRVATPFTVYGHFKCSPVGYPDDLAQTRATDHLTAREEARVEQALWTGDLGNVPNLRGLNMDAGSTVSLGGGTIQEISNGLALLENHIAVEYGSLGVIHMRRGAALVAMSKNLLKVSGARLLTQIGTPVVAGAGYTGSSPAGAAPAAGESWAYASPALFGYQSEIFTASNRQGDLLNRNTNDLYAVAERSYLLGFDPCGVGAVLLDTSPTA
jgi:hypothetical protein